MVFGEVGHSRRGLPGEHGGEPHGPLRRAAVVRRAGGRRSLLPIIAGCGIIENDSHDRPDLAPNLCALYVEEAHRGRGIAGQLLDHACAETGRQGLDYLYLVTDHVGFYERYGWEYLGDVHETDGGPIRLYQKATAAPTVPGNGTPRASIPPCC